MAEDLLEQRPYPVQEISPGVYDYKGKQYTAEQIEQLYEKEKKRHEIRAAIVGTGNSPFMMFTFMLPKARPDYLPEETQQAPPETEIRGPTLPEPMQEETPFEPAEVTDDPAPGEAIKPEIIKPKAKEGRKFNLLGEIKEQIEQDKARTERMNQFKNINKGLL